MFSKTIGLRLFELRKQKNWSQEQTADYLNISRSAYQRIETGEGFSWSNNLEKICEIFEILPEDLLKDTNIVINSNQQGGNSTNAYVINQLSDKLIEQYEERIKELKETINSLKKQIE
ncbi:helix-turn-helix domain-containing protein [Flavobacterium sp.]|jgi:transcriptional regulator with XRE-family HTH domain|uniref:helix-turn-helix domain-containing protein n=1 Tax=Flavobacterium sp. TaxID=239 RepID=UPI0037C0DDC3